MAITEFGQQVIAAADKPAPPLVDKPLGPQGVSLKPSDPDEPLYDEPMPPGFADKNLWTQQAQEKFLLQERKDSNYVNPYYVQIRADLDAFLAGGDESVRLDSTKAYSNGLDTVENYLIEGLQERYKQGAIDKGVLEDIYTYPEEERLSRIKSEYRRLSSSQENTNVLVAMELMRGGYGELPREAITDYRLNSQPKHIEYLLNTWKEGLNQELRRYVDSMAAEAGESASVLELMGDIVYQDLIPFLGQGTRMLGTMEFAPESMEISTWKKGLPGEVRQSIREWWVAASHEERTQYLKDLDRTWQKIRHGENANIYTDYLVIENLMGIFTDEMLENDDPTNTADRVVENFASLLGTILGVGVVARRGKSVWRMGTSGRRSEVYHAARASGNQKLAEEVELTMTNVAEKYGMKRGEAAAVHLPKPKSDETLEALPDSVIEAHETAARAGGVALRDTNLLTGLGLSERQKTQAVEDTIQKISDASRNAHPNYKQSTLRDLDDGTGIRVTMNYGQRPGHGWTDLGQLLETVREISLDHLDSIRIMRKNRYGHMEPMDIAPSELRDYIVNGRLPAQLESRLDATNATSRLFGGRRLDRVGQQELEDTLRVTNPASEDYMNIRRELNRRADPKLDPAEYRFMDGEEFYIERTQDRYWAITDTDGFEGGFAQTWVPTWMRSLLAPNSKFSQIYQGARRAYHIEEHVKEVFSEIYKPFHQLNTRSQQKVQNVLLWAERESKMMREALGRPAEPNMAEILAEFPDLTEAELKALVSVQQGLDIQYQMFNRRLYREFAAAGYTTIRSAGDAPNYHGKRMIDPPSGSFYNPHTKQVEVLSKKQIREIEAEGGGFLDLDRLPIDVEEGGQFTHLVVRKGEYEFGGLSTSPLNYYKGYTPRLYKDPYVITKKTYNPKMNGRDQAQRTEHTEVIRTAGSARQAENYLNNYEGVSRNDNGEWVSNSELGVTYNYETAANLHTTEGTLMEAQAMYREGRMFWDERNLKRLPDVNDNPAQIWDLGHSLHKATQMAIRQTTQEDLFRTYREAFVAEFGDLPGLGPVHFSVDDLKEIKARLKRERSKVTDPVLRAKYGRALEVVNYMRSQLGVDAFLVPEIRSALVNFSAWFGRTKLGGSEWMDPILGWTQRVGMSADPFAFMRRTAFYSFMTLRPARQFLLQSMQVSMLTGLDPLYIGTGRLFKDAIGLRRGVAQLRRSGWDDGWADAKVGGMMGLSKKEYKRLVEEFDRTGMLGSVETHAFNAAGGASQFAKMPSDAGAFGRMAYSIRKKGRRVVNILQQGFDQGEMNNLTFSWLIAAKRLRKEKGYKSILEMKRSDWDKVLDDADALALAMTRPNKMIYQQGMWGMTFQFIAFQHRALLTLTGLNPALKNKKDLAKLYMGMYGLWGFNTFGAEDMARDMLTQLGVDGSMEIGGGATLQDFLSAGLVETGWNMIARANEGTELELSTFAPGSSVFNTYYNMYEAFVEKPTLLSLFGPSKTVVDTFTAGLEFLDSGIPGNEDISPREKFLSLAEYLGEGGFAGLNDPLKVWMSYQLGQYVDKEGDSLHIKTTKDGLMARGLLGVRPETEMATYEIKKKIWDNKNNVDNMVDEIRKAIRILVLQDRERTYPREYLLKKHSVVWSMLEDAPEGTRQVIYRRVMVEPDIDGKNIIQLLAESAEQGQMDMTVLAPWVRQHSELTQEQKEQLLWWIEEIQEQRVRDDISFEEMDKEGVSEWRN